DYYQFTSLINQRFSQPQKERMIELMWQVAYADAALSAHELHLMRKVAGLLHVPDSAYIAAKMRAKLRAKTQAAPDVPNVPDAP
ncbi:MAG: TerB family tellurite resistance protein, partial [Betaproteobacteria bacterium]